jgi:hypothetical protein
VSIFCPVRIPVSNNCESRLCTDISGFAESGVEQDYVCKRENSGVFSTNEQHARRPLCGQTAYGDCQCDPMPNLYTHGLLISCNETQKNAQSEKYVPGWIANWRRSVYNTREIQRHQEVKNI